MNIERSIFLYLVHRALAVLPCSWQWCRESWSSREQKSTCTISWWIHSWRRGWVRMKRKADAGEQCACIDVEVSEQLNPNHVALVARDLSFHSDFFPLSINQNVEFFNLHSSTWWNLFDSNSSVEFQFFTFCSSLHANWFHHIDTRRHSPMRSLSRWFIHNLINDVFFLSISSPLSLVVITHRSPDDHGNSVEKCCRKCVAWNVAYLQAHKAREESESRKSANSPAEVPSGDLRVSINLRVDIYIWETSAGLTWIQIELSDESHSVWRNCKNRAKKCQEMLKYTEIPDIWCGRMS